ncbi:MAG: ABC transporter ATP-binding protein [Thaumarchaeota archaeon]|nr:ABC transporter ATP-binding protein [Nitrososphaerota archaeon]
MQGVVATDTVLRTEDLTKSFGGLAAVSRVNLDVKRSTCHAVVGPNGAGKSTLFNLICGITKPTNGRVYVGGREVTGYPPHKVARLGVGRSFQVLSIFANLTALENVRIGAQSIGGTRMNMNPFAASYSNREFVEMAYEALGIVGLMSKALMLASSLTPSDKRKLDIAIALVRKPKIILLDEPTGGVSIEDVPDVVKAVKTVRAEWNPTMLLIEHKMEVIKGLADYVTVMDRGSVIAEGSPSVVEENPHVQEVYLGKM